MVVSMHVMRDADILLNCGRAGQQILYIHSVRVHGCCRVCGRILVAIGRSWV